MAISTFAELKTSIASWLARDDLTSFIPDFITLFEAAANRRLRVRSMETSTTLAPTSGVATLPTDYLLYRRVTWLGSRKIELQYAHPSWLPGAYPLSQSGVPKVFTIEGSSLKVMPISDTNIDFDYYKKIPALSDSATTNWLLTAHPDAYLFGSLVEANAFTVMPEHAVLWKARRDEAFDEIERLDVKTKGGGMIRAYGATP